MPLYRLGIVFIVPCHAQTSGTSLLRDISFPVITKSPFGVWERGKCHRRPTAACKAKNLCKRSLGWEKEGSKTILLTLIQRSILLPCMRDSKWAISSSLIKVLVLRRSNRRIDCIRQPISSSNPASTSNPSEVP